MNEDEKIDEIEEKIKANPNYKCGLYRRFTGNMLKGSTKYKVNGKEYEGNIFAGEAIVEAIIDGWWDSWERPEPKQEEEEIEVFEDQTEMEPEDAEDELVDASSGAVTMNEAASGAVTLEA